MRTGKPLPGFALLAVGAGLLGSQPASASVSPSVLPFLVATAGPAWQGGQNIELSDLSDPAELERRLRDLAARGAALTVPGGRVHRGDFGLGSLDTLRGHLLVLDGSASIFGRLDGNLVVLGGDILVQRGGEVTGDALALGGTVTDLTRGVAGETRALGTARPVEIATRPAVGLRVAGFAGVVLALLVIGFGLVTFARPALEIVSDTVTHSFARAFLVGLLAEILVIPTFGMLVVGLALTVVGVLLIPFAVVAYGLIMGAAAVLGLLAVAHAMGETHTRRRMAMGIRISPNSYRYVLVGLAGVLAIWLVWLLFGWVPVAGVVVLGAALLVTWIFATVGFGASILSRFGVRPEFAGRIIPPEALTDEYLWATPQFGVPAATRPEKKKDDRET